MLTVRCKNKFGQGGTKDSKLTDDVVYPDGWRAMMVSICMAVYSLETIAELITYICKCLCINIPNASPEEVKNWIRPPNEDMCILLALQRYNTRHREKEPNFLQLKK